MTGRPLIFEDPEEMQEAIDEYFDFCDNRIQHVYNAKAGGVIEIINPAPYTIMGLARTLNMTRETLLQYEKKDAFSDTIKRAKQKVAEDVETRLLDGGNATGPIFNLKNNFGYVDKKEIAGDPDRPIIQTIERVIINNETKD